MHKHEPAYLMDLANRILGSQAKADEWLGLPRVQLGGRACLIARKARTLFPAKPADAHAAWFRAGDSGWCRPA